MREEPKQLSPEQTKSLIDNFREGYPVHALAQVFRIQESHVERIIREALLAQEEP